MSSEPSNFDNSFINGKNGTANNQKVSAYNSSENEAEVDLFKLLNLLIHYKWVVVAFVTLSTLVSVVLFYFQIPIYQSQGTIFISESKNRYSYAGSDLANLLTTTYGIGVGSTIANELQIIRSRTLSEGLADSVLNKKFLSNGELMPILWKEYPTDSTIITRENLSHRIKTGLVAEQISSQTDLVRILFESPSPEEAAYMVNLVIEVYSKVSTKHNRSMATSALTFLSNERVKILKQLENTEDQLKRFMESSKILSVDSQTRQLITNISNLETQKQDITVKLVAVNASLNNLQSQLAEVEPSLSSQFSSSVTPLIERYQYELAELKTEKFLLLSKNPKLKNDPTNPEINYLDSQIEEVQSQVKELTDQLINSGSNIFLSLLQNDNEGGLGNRIIDLNERLLTNQIRKSEFDAQINAIDAQLVELNAQIDVLPDNIIDLARLQRDVKINEQLYLLVSNQFAEMTLWERTQIGMGRPLDLALITRNPIKPIKIYWLAVGFLLGGIIGVGFILMKEAINDTIKSTDILKSFGLPFLGAIPDFKVLDDLNPNERQFIDNKSVSNQLITFIDHISPISEAYRRLRINVIYANPDKNYKVIMVTSATKGEGKSTVAANLAVTFSEAEKSVLIIDLDLRRPTQHKIFGENREPGLTDSLFETVKISDITNTTLAPNVDLITVGKKTPEPASVLDSKRLKQLIDKLSERYDHIILDTAPYGIISDSASLLRLVDGIVVVSRFNVTTKRELAFTLDGLSHLNADVLGLVLNAFNPKKSTDYYTNYSYYKRTYSEYYQENS